MSELRRLVAVGALVLACGPLPLADAAAEVTDSGPIVVAAGPASGACGCADIADMLNRIKEADAAVAAYRKEIAVLLAAPKGSDPVMATDANYRDLQDNIVQAEINKVTTPGSNRPRSGTNGACEIDIPATTACMRQSRQIHEAVHQRACLAMKTKEDFLVKSYFNFMTLVDFAWEEIDSYLSERKFLADQLRNLPATCKPKGWTGTVEYNEQIKTAKSKTIPAVTNGTRGGTESATYEKQHTASITVIDGRAFARTDYVEKSFWRQEITSIVRCHSNEAPRDFPHHRADTTSSEAHGYTQLPSFSVSAGSTGYRISFSLPAVEGTYDLAHDVTPPACPGPFKPAPGSHSAMRFGGTSYSVVGGADAGDTISGSDTKTTPLADGTRTVTVSWHLSRGQGTAPAVSQLDPGPVRHFALAAPAGARPWPALQGGSSD